MRLAVATMLLAGISSSAFACGEGASQMLAKSPTDLQVFAALEPITVSKPFGIELTLCGDKINATVEADAWMPRHKHGMNYAPIVVSQGGGKFAVSNFVFHMPGLWQVRVNVRADNKAGPETYLLDVQVK